MHPSSTSKNILIIGAKGKMGSLFGKLLSSRGHNITSLEKEDVLDKNAIMSADIVIIAVPMSIAASITESVARLSRKDALLLDINSLKSEVCSIMKEHCQSECMGTHPLFGPSVKNIRGQNIIVCPIRSGELSEYFLSELQALGSTLTYSSPEEHDKMMAVVQVLVHFNTIVMGETLRDSGVSIFDTLKFTSPIYKLELALIGRLFAQDPSLYAEILLQNPYSKNMRELFLETANKVSCLMDKNDREAFKEHFAFGKEYFSYFAEESMELSDRIIEEVVTKKLAINDRH